MAVKPDALLTLESWSSSSGVETRKAYIKYKFTTRADAALLTWLSKVWMVVSLSHCIFLKAGSPGKQAHKSFDFACRLHQNVRTVKLL